jgi:membrane peptidoglycan carboxypeptidase
VVDRDGNLLEEAQPRREQVLTPYVAGQMVDLMRGAVQYGTAASASSLGHELAGKTGTVNDFTDAWFIGYTPSVVCGVWIGYSDQKRTLGQGEAGASAALPQGEGEGAIPPYASTYGRDPRHAARTRQPASFGAGTIGSSQRRHSPRLGGDPGSRPTWGGGYAHLSARQSPGEQEYPPGESQSPITWAAHFQWRQRS